MSKTELNITNSPNQTNVIDFLNLINNMGYSIVNSNKMAIITEMIAIGNTSFINKLNSLKKLEEDLTWGEKVTAVFQEDIKSALDALANIVNSLSLEEAEKIDSTAINNRIRALKTKLGIMQDYERIRKAKENIASIQAKIDSLGTDPTKSYEEKLALFQSLTEAKHGSNMAIIKNAELVASTPIYDINFINEVALEIKSISDFISSIINQVDIKDKLAAQVDKTTLLISDYQIEIVKYNNAKRTYDILLVDLGIAKLSSDNQKIETVVSQNDNNPTLTTSIASAELAISSVIDRTQNQQPEDSHLLSQPIEEKKLPEIMEAEENYKKVTYKGPTEDMIAGIDLSELIIGEEYLVIDEQTINNITTNYKLKRNGRELPGIYPADLFNNKEKVIEHASSELESVLPDSLPENILSSTDQKINKGRTVTAFNESAVPTLSQFEASQNSESIAEAIVISIWNFLPQTAYTIKASIGSAWGALYIIKKTRNKIASKELADIIGQGRKMLLERGSGKITREEISELAEVVKEVLDESRKVEKGELFSAPAERFGRY